jgi:hypothetical protein
MLVSTCISTYSLDYRLEFKLLESNFCTSAEDNFMPLPFMYE